MPDHPETAALDAVQAHIGYVFRQPELLVRALTHRSLAADHMERLEFLGDAVLGLAMSEYLHGRYPTAGEGQLSRTRATLVCKASLQKVAKRWQLADNLRVGEGERGDSGLRSPSIAANAVEAVIGAVFTDAGWEVTRRLVLAAWQPLLAEVDVEDGRDAKSRLQELTQGRGWGLPEYLVHDFGVGKSPRFEAQCMVNGQKVGMGRGERKKDAEMQSAEQACNKLKR
jgi:ribonuclease-3